MFEELQLRPRSVNFMLHGGGLGDMIAAMVPIQFVLKNWPQVRPIIWVFDPLYELFTNVFPDVEIRMHSEVRVSNFQDSDGNLRTTSWDGKTSPMKMSLVDYACIKLIDRLLPDAEKNAPRLKREGISLSRLGYTPPKDKYVVVTTGHTASVRSFPAQEVNLVTKFIKSRGYEIVFLGQTSTATSQHPKSHVIQAQFDKNIDYRIGYNFIDKTSLLEAAALIHDAAAVIGVDSGLCPNLAGLTEVPIICGFTTVSPQLRWPTRNGILGQDCYEVVPDESLNCRFCQSDAGYLFEHDYRNCMWENRLGHEDKIKLCTKQLKAEKFIAALEQVL